MMTEAGDERGSVLPLGIGYALLALAVVLVCINATSLHLSQKRLESLADAAALAAADGFRVAPTASGIGIELDEHSARRQAEEVITISPVDAHLVSVTAHGGNSARVTVRATWDSFLLSVFVPAGVDLEATATSRASLSG
ncbi:pilus assembly protein TadG-related protein [Microbacterium amylolyticum]|uniref:Membrane protein n=1 Tax=Microbacterium amylolyticum TaxID=936337 RepID=A0ABS4ZKK3_9MICO|nr:pilus assembly protein TadG-related protein [Microbacterium amylolyticum]MBP2437814.1 putative membrane protein [Microbacterium amylolyticum]